MSGPYHDESRRPIVATRLLAGHGHTVDAECRCIRTKAEGKIVGRDHNLNMVSRFPAIVSSLTG